MRAMTRLSCTIWILAALLVVATLDNLPDPPAVSPRTTICKVGQPQVCVSHPTIARGNSHNPADSLRVHQTAPETFESRHCSLPIALAMHAADSSPPRAYRA